MHRLDIVRKILPRAIAGENINQFLQQYQMSYEDKYICTLYLRAKYTLFKKIRKYDFNIISLGMNCGTYRFINRWNMGNIAQNSFIRLPFDLGACRPTEPDYILRLLESDFDDFKNVDNITRYKGQDGIEYFNLKNGKYFFNHDSVLNYNNNICQFHHQLLLRIKNFTTVLLQNKTVLLMYLPTIPDDSIKFCAMAENIAKKLGVKIIFLSNSYFTFKQVSHDDENNILIVKMPSNVHLLIDGEYNNILTKENFLNEWNIAINIQKFIAKVLPEKEKYVDKMYHTIDRQSQLNEVLQIGDNYLVQKYLAEITGYLNKFSVDLSKKNGAIVMNCNPFTHGHRLLIEYASKQVDNLIIFVVEEDKSFFSFCERFKMVKDGVIDIDNVYVVRSGNFILSHLTFPAYFEKNDIDDCKNIDVSNDINIFAHLISHKLNITSRFIGEEPMCKVTRRYNESMKKILPSHSIQVFEIPRFIEKGGHYQCFTGSAAH
jgi:cytidyltransferase-like protein